MELGDNIVCNKLYRDYRFKSKRNYGLYVRLLKVEDTQNILDYTYQTGTEPLCMTYKISNGISCGLISSSFGSGRETFTMSLS